LKKEKRKGKVKHKNVKGRFKIEDIPTQTQQVIYDSEEKKAYTVNSALAEILNRQQKIINFLIGEE